ncbi:hypothetical protein [Actinotalea sp.]|uniref:hypothetical protein n=1 Tax=Actinotalea sp. TaxID=1872145 RepID=UPI003565ED89
MDPNNGRLYPSVEAAKAAGVTSPVLVEGAPEDVQRVSDAVASAWTREQKSQRNARNKVARASRRTNRKRGA